MGSDPTERFSSRVANYIKYRPSYPSRLFATLQDFCCNDSNHDSSILRVADIGAGTGIFTGLMLDIGWHVTAIEPNDAMRAACDTAFAEHPRYSSVAAKAEKTKLRRSSVDLVTAAQAFHWFEVAAVRLEFQRILEPDGCVTLIWNERKFDSPFLQDYEAALVRYATDYNEVRHENTGRDILDRFYSNYQEYSYPNAQIFDLQGLLGRLESSSYCPPVGHPNHDWLVGEVSDSFHRNQQDGKVTFAYETRMYVGRV